MSDVQTTKRRAMPQMRRLKIWEAYKGICIWCHEKIRDSNWIIEHAIPLGLGGDDSDENCAPAHEHCRREKDKEDIPRIAKAKRQKARHIGIKKPSRFPGGRQDKWKRKVSGETVLR